MRVAFQGQVGANQRKWWSLLAEDRAGAKRSDHFIVAHVNYPNIGTRGGAITGNGENDVGINGGHRRIHDLEVRAGMAQFQHGLQHSRQPETRLRIAQRGRFAKNDNANGVGAFDLGKANGFRYSGHGRTEKAPAKPVVLNQNFLSIAL